MKWDPKIWISDLEICHWQESRLFRCATRWTIYITSIHKTSKIVEVKGINNRSGGTRMYSRSSFFWERITSMLKRCGDKKSSNSVKAHLTHVGCMDRSAARCLFNHLFLLCASTWLLLSNCIVLNQLQKLKLKNRSWMICCACIHDEVRNWNKWCQSYIRMHICVDKSPVTLLVHLTQILSCRLTSQT